MCGTKMIQDKASNLRLRAEGDTEHTEPGAI